MGYRVNIKQAAIVVAILSLIVIIIRGCVFAAAPKETPIEMEFFVFDDSIMLSVYCASTETTVEMGLEEYVFGVVSAEIPASYNVEAIKAQAVAARTYAVRRIEAVSGGKTAKCASSGADICTDSSCCQAYKSASEQMERWGNDYSMYAKKVYDCVMATRGEIVVYDDEPISALYHSSSGGMTEDSENVYAAYYPYLRSVVSPGEEKYSDYSSETTMTYGELSTKLNDEFPTAKLKASTVNKQIQVTERYESGRVKTVRIGATTCSGRELRKALELRSTNFDIVFQAGKAIITSKGYGHGVGMSQTGANAMANAGSDYREILLHYYSGTQITSIKE